MSKLQSWRINLPIRRGCEIKSRSGTGIFLTKYSQTASTLYLSCADTGIIGAPSAIVPIGTKYTA